MKPNDMVSTRFDEEDLAILESICAKEKLKRSDVIRRAVRHYAEHIDALPPPAKRRAGK